MTTANLSLESIKTTACQYVDYAAERGAELYGEAKVYAGRAYQYLGQKASEGFSALSAKVSQLSQRAFEYLSDKYRELTPKINQCKQYVARQYESLKNDFTRLLDGRSLQYFREANPEVKSDIILKSVAATLVGGLFLGTLGAVAAGSIALAKLAK